MKRAELNFRNILGVLDPDFSDFMLEKDYKLLEIDGITDINMFDFQKRYWTKPLDEVTINPNANMGNAGESKKSFSGLVSEMSAPINKLSALVLIRKYGNKKNSNGDKLVNSIINGEIYHHNLTLYSLPYCIGISLYPLVTEGLQFGDLLSNPPKRPTSFVNQTIRYIQYASTVFAGAIALTDFFAHYSYYTSLFPDYSNKQREQDIQNMVHGLSDSCIRIGSQSPFSNVSILSPETMRYMFGNYIWEDKKIDDLIPEIMRNQRIYTKFFSIGQIGTDRKPLGIPYRFPITTFVAEPSFKKEYPEIFEEILTDNAKLCYLNIMNNMEENLKSLALCCRLTNKIEDLLELQDTHINNTFGSFLQVGSHQVVSVSLPRIALETKDETKFLEVLRERCQLARELLLIHREEILQKRRLKYHFFFKRSYLDLKRNFFSTIGFIGLPNAIEILFNRSTPILEKDGMEFAKKILKTMKEESVRYSQEDGYMYNIEEVPAESAAGSLARKDALLMKGAYEYYDSQFIPLSYEIDIFDRINAEGELQEFCTGGSISHLNLDGKPDEGALIELTNKILKTTKLRHFAFNMGFTVCENRHTTTGINKKCPLCLTEKVSWATRVVGYFTFTSTWNKAKQTEFSRRKWSNIK